MILKIKFNEIIDIFNYYLESIGYIFSHLLFNSCLGN